MQSERDILKYLSDNPEGASITEISKSTNHTRATAAKYLELMKLKGKVDFREVGKAKLWVLTENSRKILIAEDEEHIRRLVKVILGQDGYEFIEASDGKQALEKVSNYMPDLIILDIMMPNVDGIEVCKQLKNNVLTKKIPIIMLTAKRELTDKISGIMTGADDYLTKPFEPRELRVRVKTFLDKSKQERNPITNLPFIHTAFNKLKNVDKQFDFNYLFFKNLDVYQNMYGFSKTDELIRLTSQIITHVLEKYDGNNFVVHDYKNNFIIISKSSISNEILKFIKNEFESTIPFFYEEDYENIDMKYYTINLIGHKGSVEKKPLVQLNIKAIDKNIILDYNKINEKLMNLIRD